MEYFIEKRQYHNHLGKPSDLYYFIFSYRKFIGIFKYKKYITETICGMGGCYNSIIEFKTVEKAEKFIQNTLCPKVPREKTKKEIIKSINCNE